MSQRMTQKTFEGTSGYLVSPDLRDAVNVAIDLEKPLLIKGEPGTGKTRLAEAVAEALGARLLVWNVKSTSKARDGLYVYDTVARLNDARFNDRDIRDVRQYIKYGPLGRALLSEERVVLLIDEIDKADMEFPNDLLHELDRMSFAVDETGETITAKKRPVVIITSNNEKELPDAFLRRCVFHFIAFPDEELMKDIVRVHHPDVEDKLLSSCLVRFYWLRKQPDIKKRPSTSELIDWIAALRRAGIPVERLEGEMPFVGLLLKKEADVEALVNVKTGRLRSIRQ
ncbi:MAG: MoxR family ATPase [Deltaproteobacteria bacterium]|nr:MoxR family ATPase [Deltaproteobacteria bacterium]